MLHTHTHTHNGARCNPSSGFASAYFNYHVRLHHLSIIFYACFFAAVEIFKYFLNSKASSRAAQLFRVKHVAIATSPSSHASHRSDFSHFIGSSASHHSPHRSIHSSHSTQPLPDTNPSILPPIPILHSRPASTLAPSLRQSSPPPPQSIPHTIFQTSFQGILTDSSRRHQPPFFPLSIEQSRNTSSMSYSSMNPGRKSQSVSYNPHNSRHISA